MLYILDGEPSNVFSDKPYYNSKPEIEGRNQYKSLDKNKTAGDENKLPQWKHTTQLNEYISINVTYNSCQPSVQKV